MEWVDNLRTQLRQHDIFLDEAVLLKEVDFLMELLRWNKTYNLTSITDPVEAIEKHLIDSMLLLPYLDDVESILDIGSGGGFPGIPLQIARPQLRVTSVDAVAKKITFQRHVARQLKLNGLTPWHGRIEEVPRQDFSVSGFDFVVARAFSSLRDLIRLALPCVKPNGQIVAMKGPDGEKELNEMGDWLVEQGVCCDRQIFYSLPQSEARRSLLFFKVKPQDVV
jgi:16S rRNA (guanine527-N7)-methyltransferase